jgi:hypothetical protein
MPPSLKAARNTDDNKREARATPEMEPKATWCQEIINGNRTFLLAWHQILAHRNARKHRKLWAISEMMENPKSGASTSSAIPA